jgi:hypothetical protein
MSSQPEPELFQLNAWTGAETAAGELIANPSDWMATQRPVKPDGDFYPRVRKLRDWRAVGWGLILPYQEGVADAQQASADDAPEPIRQLVQDRKGVVLRYRAQAQLRMATLYDPRRGVPLEISEHGDEGQNLPAYLLIYGLPEAIPWRLQFALNSAPGRFVGRLALEGEALEHYVSALRNDWATAPIRRDAPLIWAVDHGSSDITRLMRNAIAARLAQRYQADADLREGARFLDGQQGQGRAADLIEALQTQRPALIVSTSHGMTGPLDNPTLMGHQLGWLVDQGQQALDPSELLAAWQPDGAIWYAHACCSAGSLRPSAFSGLVQPHTMAGRVLAGLAALGDRIAPLPQALLGARQPLRAFIGHVEPTFNYTLQQPGTRQFLTGGIIEMLNELAFDPDRYPVGMMAQGLFEKLGHLASQYNMSYDDGEERGALYYQLCFRDLQSTVILGDPTVALPGV